MVEKLKIEFPKTPVTQLMADVMADAADSMLYFGIFSGFPGFPGL